MLHRISLYIFTTTISVHVIVKFTLSKNISLLKHLYNDDLRQLRYQMLLMLGCGTFRFNFYTWNLHLITVIGRFMMCFKRYSESSFMREARIYNKCWKGEGVVMKIVPSGQSAVPSRACRPNLFFGLLSVLYPSF